MEGVKIKAKLSKTDGMKRSRRAVSPVISMVIITTVTIVLVLVASSYAYQVLEIQRGASEFDAVKKSFTTFDDAIWDVSFDKYGSRSARFTVNYGVLEVIPADVSNRLTISVVVNEYSDARYDDFTGFLRYNLSIRYVNFGNGYKTYLFGDNQTIITEATKSSGTAIIEQRSKWVTITLFYKVKSLGVRVVKVDGQIVNYVDIFIIKMTATRWSTFKGDFDLVARNKNIMTISHGPYDAGENCHVTVSIGGLSDTMYVTLEPGLVVFNFIVAEVQVGG